MKSKAGKTPGLRFWLTLPQLLKLYGYERRWKALQARARLIIQASPHGDSDAMRLLREIVGLTRR